MGAKELIEYLSKYPEDAPVSFIIGDLKTRKLYPVEKVAGLTGEDTPAFLIEVGAPESMDQEVE